MAYNPYNAASKITEEKIKWANASAQGLDTTPYEQAAKAYYQELRDNGRSDVADRLQASDAVAAGEYLKELNQPKTQYDSNSYSYDVPKPTYESKNSERIEKLYDAISNYEPFSYDLESDPMYQQLRQQYIREGKRATEDTMGAYASMTGGIPSSYAVTAAAQAGNYYNSQLNDKALQLYEAAYNKYYDNYNKKLDELNMFLNAENTNYSKYLDTLDDWYKDAEIARKNYESDRDFQTDINMYSDELARNDAKIAAGLGDYSGYKNLGFDTTAAENNNLIAELLPQPNSQPLSYYENTQPTGVVQNDNNNLWTSGDVNDIKTVTVNSDSYNALLSVLSQYTPDEMAYLLSGLLESGLPYDTYLELKKAVGIN